ncbi:hypothetical protein FRB97_004316 [Tulasnella sp. 331]|nr:hypothetical protein FRB97_004316 [Tulasnella sp. 331]
MCCRSKYSNPGSDFNASQRRQRDHCTKRSWGWWGKKRRQQQEQYLEREMGYSPDSVVVYSPPHGLKKSDWTEKPQSWVGASASNQAVESDLQDILRQIADMENEEKKKQQAQIQNYTMTPAHMPMPSVIRSVSILQHTSDRDSIRSAPPVYTVEAPASVARD